MRYLCLIYPDGDRLAALPAREMSELNAAHLEFNDQLLASGHFIEAEALEPSTSAACVRVQGGKVSVTDGPYAETKEVLGGFYLLEARDLNEAIQLAARIPSMPIATVEVRPCRDLEVDGISRKSSRKARATSI